MRHDRPVVGNDRGLVRAWIETDDDHRVACTIRNNSFSMNVDRVVRAFFASRDNADATAASVRNDTTTVFLAGAFFATTL
jgi:hypothetical protein